MVKTSTGFALKKFSVDDFARPGWSSEILVSHFSRTGNKPETGDKEYALNVLTHLDQIVMERADEVLRNFGHTGSMVDKLVSDHREEVTQGMMAVESVLWSVAYEYGNYDAVYRMARESLFEQQMGVGSQLLKTSLQRLCEMESMLSTADTDPVSALTVMRNVLKQSDPLYVEFKGLCASLHALLVTVGEVAELNVDAAYALNQSLSKMTRFGWFKLAMSGEDPRAEVAPRPAARSSFSMA